jgi:hypothetical protein
MAKPYTLDKVQQPDGGNGRVKMVVGEVLLLLRVMIEMQPNQHVVEKELSHHQMLIL